MNPRLRVCVGVGLLLAGPGPGVAPVLAQATPPPVVQPTPGAYDAFTQFARFLEIALQRYADPAQFNELNRHTTAGLRAFLRSLDPEADLFTPAEVAQRAAPPPANTVAFGAKLGIRNGSLVIISARDGSPAQRAGLLGGERITAINDQPVAGERLADVHRALDGPANAQFILSLLDPATGPRTLVIRRTPPAAPPTAQFQLLADGIAYLRVPEFTFAVTESIVRHLDTLPPQRARALIMDLRHNPGGAIDATVVAASLFLPAKTEIVTLIHPRGRQDAPFVSSQPRPANLPTIVLVNRSTAAEAEIFAAALRDNGAARLVGAATAGVGRLFGEFPLPDGAQVYLPTAEFQTPAGVRFHGRGLTPDIAVALPDETERRLTGVGFGNFRWAANPKRVLDTDLQLARAVELLRRAP